MLGRLNGEDASTMPISAWGSCRSGIVIADESRERRLAAAKEGEISGVVAPNC